MSLKKIKLEHHQKSVCEERESDIFLPLQEESNLQESARERERVNIVCCCLAHRFLIRTIAIVARTHCCRLRGRDDARARLLRAVAVVARESGVLGLRWPPIDGRIQQPTDSRLRR